MKKILSTRYFENSWSFALLLMLKHGLDKLSDFANVKGMHQVFGSPIDAILVIFAEVFCSIFLVLGLFTRFAVIPLIITMGVVFFKVKQSVIYGKDGGEEVVLYLLAYCYLFITGPGKFSIDRMIAK
jgi:putative oxidoreductase